MTNNKRIFSKKEKESFSKLELETENKDNSVLRTKPIKYFLYLTKIIRTLFLL